MSLLKKIMKKKTSFNQSDNKGTYHNNVDIASEYWVERKKLKKFEPFLLYKFTDESDAVRALLELECIKIAEDTEEIICTEPFIYGYYPVESGDYEVVLCGSALSDSLYSNAKRSFESNNGEMINEKKPEDKKVKSAPKIEKVPEEIPVAESKTKNIIIEENTSKPEAKPEAEFVSEEKKLKNGVEVTIKIYKALNSGNAIAFLETKLILKKNLVLIVKTPHEIYGRNYNGIYKVQKPALD